MAAYNQSNSVPAPVMQTSKHLPWNRRFSGVILVESLVP